MKLKILFCILTSLLLAVFTGCNEDKGNYDYDFSQSPELIIDTIGVDISALRETWSLGTELHLIPNITYEGKKDRLVYRWFVMDNNYKSVTEGNTQVWPQPDTISYTLDLNYTVNLEAGKRYQLWFMARDSVNGSSAYFKMMNYLPIPEASTAYGIYCLQEKEGRIDIDVFSSRRTLIMSDSRTSDLYSSLYPNDPLEGKAKLLAYSTVGKYFYLFTDRQGMRISPSNMVTMEHWEEMFYQAPALNPQAFMSVNNCDFLINDGRLHVLYVTAAGDRKFPIPITGNYELAPTLAFRTIGTSSNQIGAYQVVFDKNTGGFRPFYNRNSTLGMFRETADPTASVFDVNHMEGEFIYAATVNGGETMVILKQDNEYIMNVACFYNVPDNGKLDRYTRSLAGCEGIENASCFCSGIEGAALFYGSGSNVYSYSYATGQTTSHLLWEGEAGDEITTMLLLSSGGFPTGGRVLWIAVWNEQKQQGRVVEFEIEPLDGTAIMNYSGWTGVTENPTYHEGFGKIISMVEKTQYN